MTFCREISDKEKASIDINFARFSRIMNVYIFSLMLSEGLFSPSVLLSDLSFFFGSEIILDIEVLSNFLNRLILDLGGNLGTRKFKKWLDIQVVCGHD